MHLIIRLAIAAIMLLPCTPASAAIFSWSDNHFQGAVNGMITNQIAITQGALANSANTRARRQPGVPSALQSAPRPTAASRAAATYRVSLERRRANLARFIAKSRKVDPKGAAAMAQLTASKDIIAEIGTALRPYGLRVDDVADAYTMWWMDAWDAAHGRQSSPDRGQYQAVRAQALQAITTTPEFARADDAAKQEYAEALLVQAAMIEAMIEKYGSDPAMARKIAASVRQGARASGLNLDAMTLTPTGFVLR
ncbi:hypothetical protein SAMN06297144_1537 [Sphingomonas guangdongensis]|uniref:Uncharacterized protein n=1 Tax=Sphingomonas guangdongensis TaxID=1141890 RepID=A0A285R262_9SPHN|nr:DUF6683 family protein [Sphingomonas guangdongensis]SOB86432.1 hypothetical protein SAMN06297144_1537 [Sphingomonas guangdongensis]